MSDSESAQELQELTLYKYRLTGLEVRPVDVEHYAGSTNYYYSDTLANQVMFEVRTETELVDSTVIEWDSSVDVMQNEIVNPITIASANPVLRFDKPIVLDGEEVGAEINLATVENIRKFIRFPTSMGTPAKSRIRVEHDRVFIPPDTYSFYVEYTNEDGDIFADSTEAYISYYE